MGWIVGTAFWGFTLAMVLMGPLVDLIGMKRIIYVAFTLHVAGITTYHICRRILEPFHLNLVYWRRQWQRRSRNKSIITAMYPEEKTKN